MTSLSSASSRPRVFVDIDGHPHRFGAGGDTLGVATGTLARRGGASADSIFTVRPLRFVSHRHERRAARIATMEEERRRSDRPGRMAAGFPLRRQFGCVRRSRMRRFFMRSSPPAANCSDSRFVG